MREYANYTIICSAIHQNIKQKKYQFTTEGSMESD